MRYCTKYEVQSVDTANTYLRHQLLILSRFQIRLLWEGAVTEVFQLSCWFVVASKARDRIVIETEDGNDFRPSAQSFGAVICVIICGTSRWYFTFYLLVIILGLILSPGIASWSLLESGSKIIIRFKIAYCVAGRLLQCTTFQPFRHRVKRHTHFHLVHHSRLRTMSRVLWRSNNVKVWSKWLLFSS